MGYVLEHKLERNDPLQIQQFAQESLRLTLQHENVKKVMEDPNEHFDAVIADLVETELPAG